LRNDLVFPENRDIIAMAANPIGQVAFLLWPSNNTDAVAEIMFLDNNRLSHAVQLSGAIAPFSIGWVEGDRWAVLFKDLNEALTYRVPRDNPPEKVEPAGDHFPLVIGPLVEDRANRPFCNTLTQPVYYQASPDGMVFRPKPLYRLSMQELATGAMVKGARPFDSGQRGTVWHRIYLEASLPPGTGVKVFLAASDDAAMLEDSAPVPLEDMLEDSVEDNEHCFGSVSPSAKDAPVGSWVPEASEIPFHPGLLYCRREKDHAGLFTALVQRPGRRVRTLKGRYLRVKLELTGNGHVSPEISALRIYAPRFSYVDHYLPELYRETEFGPQADAVGAATGADFLQRFLGLFEGILTSIEDKIAAAHLVTDAYSAPPEALDWLAGWIGLTLEPGLPLRRKRRMISEATSLYRERATLNGLKRALNIATDDLVDQGGIVIVEDFRLRRTFATILGADLADEEDPLMMGIVASGNSYVGDTLFLGEEEEKEFLALYTPDIPGDKEEEIARIKEKEIARAKEEERSVQNLFERLANRITVLVHREMSEEEFRLVRRVVELEIPAHVQARIFSASNPLLVGLSSLVSVDTYISERKQPQAVQVGKSRIGRGDRIQDVANLDPRLE
jgi:phage tail-like protein